MKGRRRTDDGSAIVEFVWLAVLLMVPLVYVVLAAGAVQRAAFADAVAARAAARAYATAGSDALGERRAEDVVALIMRDHGLEWTARGRVIECGPCSYAPGSVFTVALHQQVALPFVPTWMCGQRCVAGIGVGTRHVEHLDCYATC